MSNLLTFLTYPDPFMVDMPTDDGESSISHEFELNSHDGRYTFHFVVDVYNYQNNRNKNPELDDYDTCDYTVKLDTIYNEDDDKLELTKDEKKQIENELLKLIES